jgi:AraC family transcriptional regulator of adaptative response / DNA-3-methyladenine glycosylase II
MEPAEKTHAILLHLQLSDLSDLSMLVQRCRHFFDLDAIPSAVTDVLATDPLLAPLVAARPGLRIPGTVDGFELAVRAILGQQISVAGARTLAGRIVSTLGEPLKQPSGTLTHYFAAPQAVAQSELQGLGLTKSRIIALRALARAVADDGLELDRSAEREQTIGRLLQLPGVGPWTASYIAMRALGDPDAFPLTDLGLQRALERQGVPADRKSIEKRAEAWRPWRAYATHHLWASLATAPTPRKNGV